MNVGLDRRDLLIPTSFKMAWLVSGFAFFIANKPITVASQEELLLKDFQKLFQNL